MGSRSLRSFLGWITTSIGMLTIRVFPTAKFITLCCRRLAYTIYSLPLTKSRRSSPVCALLWSICPAAIFGRGPAFPAIGLVEQVGVFFAVQLGLGGAVLFQAVEVFQKQQPGSLLGVIQLGGAAGLFPEYVVDVFEGLLEHAGRHLGEWLSDGPS